MVKVSFYLGRNLCINVHECLSERKPYFSYFVLLLQVGRANALLFHISTIKWALMMIWKLFLFKHITPKLPNQIVFLAIFMVGFVLWSMNNFSLTTIFCTFCTSFGPILSLRCLTQPGNSFKEKSEPQIYIYIATVRLRWAFRGYNLGRAEKGREE